VKAHAVRASRGQSGEGGISSGIAPAL
jgi:hypothetical protein